MKKSPKNLVLPLRSLCLIQAPDIQVESRIGYQIQYVTDCQYINQPACSLNACGPQGR